MKLKIERLRPEGNTRPCQRVLTVLIHIGRYGPLSMDSIAEDLGLHKSTVWRSVEALKGLDLIRAQRGTGQLELRSSLMNAFNGFHFANSRVEAADEIAGRLQSLRYIFVDVGMFHGTGTFIVEESSRRKLVTRSRRSLVFDHLAIAAQLTLSADQIEEHLRSYAPHDSQEAFEIRTGAHLRALEKYRDDLVVWAEDGASCGIAIPSEPGVAVGAELYRPTKAKLVRLRMVVEGIVAELKNSEPVRENSRVAI